jgi:hypothetical protein
MKGKRFELVQAPDAKTKDSDYLCAEIVNAMPLLQHENAECGPIAGAGMAGSSSLDQIISLLRGILIALWAIVGLLWFTHQAR